MAFVENLDVFINPDTPGYVMATIDGKPVGGLMDMGFSAGGVGFSDMEAVLPSFVCKELELAEVEHGTEFWLAETRYEVAGIEHDGHGVTTLSLKK